MGFGWEKYLQPRECAIRKFFSGTDPCRIKIFLNENIKDVLWWCLLESNWCKYQFNKKLFVYFIPTCCFGRDRHLKPMSKLLMNFQKFIVYDENYRFHYAISWKYTRKKFTTYNVKLQDLNFMLPIMYK